MVQQLIQKDKKKAKELTDELKRFHEFCKQVARQLNGMVKDVASKQWAMGKILVENKKKAEKEFGKNLLPLFYMDIARASGQDLAPRTLELYAKFYEVIPNLPHRVVTHHVPVVFYRIIVETPRLHSQINELEKRYEKGEWKTVKEFYKWVYPEEELTAVTLAKRFNNGFSKWTDEIDIFVTDMNPRDLSEEQANVLLSGIGVFAFESLPKLVKELVEVGAKPDEKIMRLIKLTKG